MTGISWSCDPCGGRKDSAPSLQEAHSRLVDHFQRRHGEMGPNAYEEYGHLHGVYTASQLRGMDLEHKAFEERRRKGLMR